MVPILVRSTEGRGRGTARKYCHSEDRVAVVMIVAVMVVAAEYKARGVFPAQRVGLIVRTGVHMSDAWVGGYSQCQKRNNILWWCYAAAVSTPTQQPRQAKPMRNTRRASSSASIRMIDGSSMLFTGENDCCYALSYFLSVFAYTWLLAR